MKENCDLNSQSIINLSFNSYSDMLVKTLVSPSNNVIKQISVEIGNMNRLSERNKIREATDTSAQPKCRELSSVQGMILSYYILTYLVHFIEIICEYWKNMTIPILD